MDIMSSEIGTKKSNKPLKPNPTIFKMENLLEGSNSRLETVEGNTKFKVIVIEPKLEKV